MYEVVMVAKKPNKDIYPIRIFSDYFQIYQEKGFNKTAYKLYKLTTAFGLEKDIFILILLKELGVGLKD